MISELDPRTEEFYRQAMVVLEKAGIAYLVGGAYSLQRYTGIVRHTKDFDIFVRPDDISPALDAFERAGYRAEFTFPHWLAKVYEDDAFVDLIFSSGNGLSRVDDEWFAHSVEEIVFGRPVRLCPVEETLWAKAFIMERERFDGADVAHLLAARAEVLDWDRLLRRFGPHGRVLLAHLILFGFTFPDQRSKIPDRVLETLFQQAREEPAPPQSGEHVCWGTLLSRSQYLIDLERGYRDARLLPDSSMTADDVEGWTAAIARDGTR